MTLDILSRLYYGTGRPDLGEAASLEAAQSIDPIEAPIWSRLGMPREPSGPRARRLRAGVGPGFPLFRLMATIATRISKPSCSRAKRSPVPVWRSGRNEEVRRFVEWCSAAHGAVRRLATRGRTCCIGTVALSCGWEPGRRRRPAVAGSRIVRAAGSRNALWRVDVALAEVYAALGDSERSLACHARAVQIVSQMASEIVDAEVRSSFLSTPDVARALSSKSLAAFREFDLC